MMNLNEMKNDTARKSAIRSELAKIVADALIEKFAEENVVVIPNKITVNDSDISGDTVAVRVGMVTVDGEEVDAVATVSATVKAWKTVTNKSNRTTYAVTLADILDEVETDAEIRAEEKAKKDAKKKKKSEKSENDNSSDITNEKEEIDNSSDITNEKEEIDNSNE